MPIAFGSRLVSSCAILAFAAGCGADAAYTSRSAAPHSLTWLKPAAVQVGWRLLVPRSGSSLLWYPPSMRPISGDSYSVSAALKDRNGTELMYLNAGPKTGNEQMSNWPSFRIDHLREELNRSVREDARGSDLAFRGGQGSCVIDDYITRVKAHHYREIACFVQGRTTESVIVAAVLARVWPKYAPQLERAVETWQVR